MSKLMNQTVKTHQTDPNSWNPPPLKPLPCKERSLIKCTWVFECRLQKTASKKKESQLNPPSYNLQETWVKEMQQLPFQMDGT